MKPWQTTQGSKQDCREGFVGAIAEHITNPASVFVMPGMDAHDATMVRNQWDRCRIRGVEKDKKTFAHIETQHPHVEIDNFTVREYLDRQIAKHNGHRHDAAFLDYTGNLNHDRLSEISDFINHVGKDKLVLGLTFSEHAFRNETKDRAKQIISDYSWIDDSDEGAHYTSEYVADAVCGSIQANSRSLIKRIGYLYHCTYRANKASVKMFFVVLLVERFPTDS